MSLKLPSTVTDKEYLRMPSDGNVVDDDEEWEKCGKWILYIPNNDLSWADKVWTDLQPLLSNGCLLLLKTSTAAFKESGVILCCTRPGQEQARKAAEAIREVVHYEYMIYHKSNKATNEGRGRRFGDGRCSQYMHTFQGHFYVRDGIGRWTFVDILNEFKISGRNHEAPKVGNFPLELQVLPSSGVTLDLPPKTDVVARQKLPERSFSIKCNLQRGEDGLVEADYVWSAVKSLYDDGDFIRIRSYPDAEIAAYICCYVTDDSDLQILLNIAKRIFKKTRISSLIYFDIRIDAVQVPIIKYVFTPQGELYEELSGGMRKFIP